MSFDHRRLLWIAVLSGALGPGARAACKIEIVGELSVATAYNRVVTAGSIDGHPLNVLIDTGAGFSFLWDSTARRLKLAVNARHGVDVYGIGGRAQSGWTVLRRLQIGTYEQTDERMVVLGADRSNPDPSEFVLGDDVLAGFSTEFDLAHGKIRLLHTDGCQPDETPYWSKTFSQADLESWQLIRPQIRARVLVNDRPMSAVFDTGAHTSMITRFAAERAGVTPWLGHQAAADEIHGIGSGKEKSWIGTFGTFAVGDEHIKNVVLRISDLFRADREVRIGSHVPHEAEDLPDMIIGCDFFLRHHMLVLPKQRKLVFTYNGGPIFQVVEPESSAH